MENKLCSRCGETLICGANQTTESCWCFSYPMIMPIASQQDCLCERCLRVSIQGKINNTINNSTQKDLIVSAQKFSSERC